MSTAEFQIARLANKWDNEPRLQSVTWSEFCELFREPRITACTVDDCRGKECPYKNGVAWSGTMYDGKGRKDENVIELTVACLDIDHVTDDDLAAIERKLDPYRHLVHSSHNDRPEDRALRCVLAISRAVKRDEWPGFWSRLVAALELPGVDPSKRNQSALYYLPSKKRDGTYWFREHDGKPIDVDAILATPEPAETPRVVDNLEIDGDGIVSAGKRHGMLISTAGALRRRGAGEGEILAALIAANKRCNPPKGSAELEEIAKWAGKQAIGEKWTEPPADSGTPADELAARRKKSKLPQISAGYGEGGGYRLTELGNARRLVDIHGDKLRFVPAWGRWLVWDGSRWRRDDTGAATRCAKDVAAKIYEQIAAAAMLSAKAMNGGVQEGPSVNIDELQKWARRSGSRGVLTATLALAETEIEVVRAPQEFDRDPWMFNAANGTIDLRAGDLHPHRQEDSITRISSVVYDPSAECPRWLAFLRQMQPDDSVRDWIWRWLGHCLTGLFTEQCMAFFIGGGSNGKNVALDVVRYVMGEYAMIAAPDLLIAQPHGDRHPTEIADLDGKRFVVCSEIEQGRQWAESTIKRITGDPEIKARHMREDFYTFPATHKITVAANTKPIVRGTDDGIWRRMRVIDWPVRIPDGSRPGERDERDTGLTSRLIATEASGILTWLVKGCIEWQKRGLEPPEVIKAATAQYRKEQDVLGQWIDDRCRVDREAWEATSALYHDYVSWCEGEGHEPWSRRAWHDRLTERRGIKDGKRGERSEIRALLGISLRGVP